VSSGLLIYGDSVRNDDLFLATHVVVGDPFAYMEVDGRRIVLTNVLEVDAVREHSGATDVWVVDEFGRRELILDGMPRDAAEYETVRRALERAGLGRVLVPPAFPIALADRLRESGLEVVPDRPTFEARRRRKDDRALAGIRTAQRATEAAMAAVRDLLASATPGRDALEAGGEAVTAERVRALIESTLAEHECAGVPPLVQSGPDASYGHGIGAGPIRAGETVVCDIFPRHLESRFHADMTRTFVAGEATPEARRMHAVVREALERSTAMIAAGVHGRAVFDAACDVVEAAGYRTQRSVAKGEQLEEDFFHGLGHGVGLDVHEAPGLGLAGDELREGDVVTVEPGLYRPGIGGVRLEDIVLVTADGHEVLTDFPYDLELPLRA
jgi:Xaa-Pro aminopeptidase